MKLIQNSLPEILRSDARFYEPEEMTLEEYFGKIGQNQEPSTPAPGARFNQVQTIKDDLNQAENQIES